MICVYYLPGLAAGIALVIYTELVLVILNAFNVTLTLPGIAGIVLSIGMAVDAKCYYICTCPRGDGKREEY